MMPLDMVIDFLNAKDAAGKVELDIKGKVTGLSSSSKKKRKEYAGINE